MKRRWGLVLVFFGACADPAALDVRVDIKAPDLEALRLVVNSGDLDGPSVVDCRIPFGAPTTDCGLEGGSGRWDDADAVSFVLFGEPDTRLAVEIDGFRFGRSVTATRSLARLPSRSGERGRLDLALFDRTEERHRCTFDLGAPPGMSEMSMAPQAQTALTVANVSSATFGFEVLMSVDGELLGATFTPMTETCELQTVLIRDVAEDRQDPFHPDRWCHVHPGSLVVGPLSARGGFVIASLCARPTTRGARVKVAVIESSRIDIRTIDLGVGLAQVSVPALADFDGDGGVDVVVLAQDDFESLPSMVRLVRHTPATGDTTSQPIGTFGSLARGRPAPAPLVVSGGAAPEQLLIVGYPGPSGAFDGRAFTPLGTGVRGTRAPVVVDGEDFLLVQELRGQLVASTRLVRPNETARWRSLGTSTAPIRMPTVPDELVRLSIGVLDGTPLVAYTEDGTVNGWNASVQPTPARLPTMASVSGGQPLLHVNLDGEPGTEFVSYAEDSNLMRAVDVNGESMVGWPLMLTGESGVRRVLITDLEGLLPGATRALRTAEVVALTYRHLEVITLGAGSYSQAEWSWPIVGGDAQGRARYSSPDDPLRR